MDAAAAQIEGRRPPRGDTPKPEGRQVSAVDAQPIRGRVDAIMDGRVLGWAWHAARPTERLKVEALVNGRVIAAVTADQARVDLKRNGIGDGAYAFDLPLDGSLVGRSETIEFRAVASSGESITLRIASNDERAAEAAVAVPLSRVLERLDLLLAVQRQLALGQRDTLAGTKSLTERVGTLSAEGGTIETAIAKVTESQGDLATRVAAIEVFLTRFDTTLAGFDKRLLALQTIGKHEVKPIVIMLATLLGFIAGVVLLAIAR